MPKSCTGGKRPYEGTSEDTCGGAAAVTVEPVDQVARAAMVRELYIDDEATQEESVAVKEAFELAGFPVTVNRGLEGGGVGEKPWGVVFSATVPLPVFFAAFVTEETHDPYAAVKAWAQEIFEARRGSRLKRGKIVIYGDDSTIRLWSDMPEMALDSLAEVDWRPQGNYNWDVDQNEWVDPRESSRRRKWSNRFLVGVVIAGLAGLQRWRRRG